MSQIHRAAARRFTPWKNGGGETAEILCRPEGAGFDEFHWRLSTAKVAQSGPFSLFPGVARVLTVIDGGAMRLHFAGGKTVTVDRASGPAAFHGDVPCQAELIGPALLDFNVMVRRPLSVAVRPADAAGRTGNACLARYLFALDTLPALDLAPHDLLELPLDAAAPAANSALLVEIWGPGDGR